MRSNQKVRHGQSDAALEALLGQDLVDKAASIQSCGTCWHDIQMEQFRELRESWPGRAQGVALSHHTRESLFEELLAPKCSRDTVLAAELEVDVAVGEGSHPISRKVMHSQVNVRCLCAEHCHESRQQEHLDVIRGDDAERPIAGRRI